MTLVKISIPEDLIEELEESFHQGPIDDRGLRRLDEELVANVNKMLVIIQADEHPPPHFHVKYAGENASFSIADGKRLPKIKGLEKFDHNIQKWWKKNYCKLIAVWNSTRPSDCPVGPTPVPEECQKQSSGEAQK